MNLDKSQAPDTHAQTQSPALSVWMDSEALSPIVARSLTAFIELFHAIEVSQDIQEAKVAFVLQPHDCLQALEKGKFVIQLVGLGMHNAPARALLADSRFADRFRVVDMARLASEILPALEAAKISELPSIERRDPKLPFDLEKSNLKGQKILVVDDKEANLSAARWQFSDQNLLHCFSSYEKALHALAEQRYDYVLSDLLMPVEHFTLSTKASGTYVGQELAFGFLSPFISARHGAKNIIVLTDMGHHDHPASALLDFVRGRTFKVDQSSVVFMDAPMKGGSSSDATAYSRVKDWDLGLTLAIERAK